MPTNVPLPTFGPLGFTLPTEAQVLAGVQADYNVAFGGNLNFTTSDGSGTNPTPQGQLTASTAAIVGEANATFGFISQQFDPSYAVGRYQDALCRIYFLERNGSLPTAVQAVCSGLSGTVIPTGAIATALDGNLYTCTGGGTIPVGGSITLPFACNADGPIACPANTLTTIFQAIPGWDSITNPTDGVLGRNTESRYQLEARRQATVAGNALNTNASLRGALLKVANVLDAYVVDNPTNSPATIGGVSIPANTLYVAVVGGLSADIATAIWTKKPPGIPLYAGNNSVVVQDTRSGYSPPFPSYTITWQTPVDLETFWAVNLVSNSGIPANAATLVQNALVSAFAGGDGGSIAGMGSLILAARYIPAVQALGPWAQVRTLQVGSANSSAAAFLANIIGTTMTVVSVASGTIAAAQYVTDLTGLVLAGTTIASGASLSWVVSATQNVGANFTGTGSGANLTASAVTGTIAVGQTIHGTGVPANTTISSQTSGTPGGAGVYVTNNATTSSANALTANETMYGVLAGSSSVQANINQEPIINSANIAVTAT